MDPSTSLAPTSLVHVCRLAEGGMGRVDLAMRRVGGFRRLYAVKRLHQHLASDPEFRAMFLDEARIAGHLRHPNVVGVLDVGEDEHGPFLVMDYVDGLPLGNLVGLSGITGEHMPVQIAVRIALDVARGLHAAHELSVDGRPLGLVHRDLSPQNVLVGFDGTARIVDFGIAKALGRTTRTATGVVKGKMGYMAPEQLRSGEPDRRSDLYSLGVVLYEMLAGDRLHPVRDGRSSRPADRDEAPPDIGEARADVPDALVRLLFELLAERPGARPPDARDVATRLEETLAELVAMDGPAAVADYVEVVAGSVRKEQARAIDEATAAAEKLEAGRVDRAKRSRSRTRAALVLLGTLVVAGAGVALALGAIDRDEPEPSTAAPLTTARPRERQPIAAPEERTPPPSEPAEPAVEEGPVPEPRAKRRVRRRRPGQAPMTTEMDLPDWVEFGQ